MQQRSIYGPGPNWEFQANKNRIVCQIVFLDWGTDTELCNPVLPPWRQGIGDLDWGCTAA